MRVQAAHVAGAEAVLVRSQLPEAPFFDSGVGGFSGRGANENWGDGCQWSYYILQHRSVSVDTF